MDKAGMKYVAQPMIGIIDAPNTLKLLTLLEGEALAVCLVGIE